MMKWEYRIVRHKDAQAGQGGVVGEEPQPALHGRLALQGRRRKVGLGLVEDLG
jgi:hypothetical protein